MTKQLWRLAAVLLAFGLIAAACGDDDDGGDAVGTEGVLTGVCPDTVVLQTDWFPEAEHGAVYNMIGDDYEVDGNNQTTTGSLVSAGVDTGVDFQIRAGGPAIGFSPTSVVTYADDSITLAYTNTEAQVIQFDDTPMVSVVAPLEINPQMMKLDLASEYR